MIQLLNSSVQLMTSLRKRNTRTRSRLPHVIRSCFTPTTLPRVSATDDGIWRRLIVIPFNAKITSESDIKNYSEYLYDNAGEAILSWIIEGARKVIELGYQIPVPKCVQEAISEYRSQNDWFAHFIEDKCEVGKGFKKARRHSIRPIAITVSTQTSMYAIRLTFILPWKMQALSVLCKTESAILRACVSVKMTILTRIFGVNRTNDKVYQGVCINFSKA